MIKAQRAVVEMRGRHLRVHGAHTSGRLRLQTDYASHECRNFFFEQCKKAGIDVRKQSELNNSTVNAASPKVADHHVSRSDRGYGYSSGGRNSSSSPYGRSYNNDLNCASPSSGLSFVSDGHTDLRESLNRSKQQRSRMLGGNGGGGRYGAGYGLRTSPESSGDEKESVRKRMVNSGGGRALKQLTFKTTEDIDAEAADERPSSACGHYSNSRTGRPAYRSSSDDSAHGSQSPSFRNSAKRKASASNEAGGRRQRKKSKGEADVKIPKIALVRLEPRPPKGASSALISEDGKSILRWMRWTFHKRTTQDALNEPLSRVEGGVEINVKDEISSKKSTMQKKRKLCELTSGESSSPLVSSHAEESLEEGEIRKTKMEKPKRRKKRTKRNIIKSFEANSSSEEVEENQPSTSSAMEALNFSQVEEVIEVGAPTSRI